MHRALSVTGDSITDENRDKKYDEGGDIVAADVVLHHSALRLLAQKVSVYLLTAVTDSKYNSRCIETFSVYCSFNMRSADLYANIISYSIICYISEV